MSKNNLSKDSAAEIVLREDDGGIALIRGGAPLLTPRKNPVVLPARALAEALLDELKTGKRFDPQSMPVCAFANAAIDVMPDALPRVAEAMMAYLETDLLLYFSETPELKARQAEGWRPWISWAESRYEVTLQTTEGVMPVEQGAEAMSRFARVLASFDAFTMAGFSALTQSLSSLLLALAVIEGAVSPAQAFALSRIDEHFQAEKWGEDSLAVAREKQLERDVQAAAAFLALLRK